MLKFTHGVEVGAYRAYIGHFYRTGDVEVLKIAFEELAHQDQIKKILAYHNTEPTTMFDLPFFFVGSIIGMLCTISPVFLLDKVAKLLEVFAVFSYDKLANKFPEHRELLLEMADTEKRHQEYFSK